MGFTIRVLSSAINDIQEAYDWYEEQSEGLGETFLEHVDTAFSHLKINPFYKIRYDNIRCLPLKTFPYMVHYSLDDKRSILFVSAIFSMKRNPKLWKGLK